MSKRKFTRVLVVPLVQVTTILQKSVWWNHISPKFEDLVKNAAAAKLWLSSFVCERVYQPSNQLTHFSLGGRTGAGLPTFSVSRRLLHEMNLHNHFSNRLDRHASLLAHCFTHITTSRPTSSPTPEGTSTSIPITDALHLLAYQFQ